MQENLKNESERYNFEIYTLLFLCTLFYVVPQTFFSSTNTKEIFQKKRIRRVMVNGVLVDRKRKREDDKTDMGEDCQ